MRKKVGEENSYINWFTHYQFTVFILSNIIWKATELDFWSKM
jgi:hypothetical protein